MGDDKSGQCAHGYYGLCPHCYDSLRAELAELRARVPVGWRPGVDNRANYSHGVPTQRDHDYWKEIGVELELVYARPVTPAAVPDDVAKDAERYRWLRDRNNSLETRQYDKGVYNGPSCYHEVDGIRELKSESKLDDAIDAAMLAERNKP